MAKKKVSKKKTKRATTKKKVTKKSGKKTSKKSAGAKKGGKKVLAKLIEDTPLSNRPRRWLQVAGIMTVGDLVKRSETDLMTLKNFAETSLAQVKKYLRGQGLKLAAERVDGPSVDDIREVLKDRKSGLTKREKDVLRMRHGLGGKKPMTLEMTGQLYDLTRERVRQIQKMAEEKVLSRTLFGG